MLSPWNRQGKGLFFQGNRMKILLNYVEITQIKYGYILQERNNKACLLQNIILES